MVLHSFIYKGQLSLEEGSTGASQINNQTKQMPCNPWCCPWWSLTLWRLYDLCSYCRSLLVAQSLSQYCMVCKDLPFMPTSPNLQYTYPTGCCHLCAFIHEDVYGYDARAPSVQIHVRYEDNMMTMWCLRRPSGRPADSTMYTMLTGQPDSIK